MQSALSNRRIISIVLFVLAVILVVVGLLSNFNIVSIVLGVAFALVGLVFYRRGK